MTKQGRSTALRRETLAVAIVEFSVAACRADLRARGIIIDAEAEQIITTISENIPSQELNLEVIRGDEFEDEGRLTSQIRDEAKRSGLIAPPKYLALHVLANYGRYRFGGGYVAFPHYPVTVSVAGQRARSRILAIRYLRGCLALAAPREISEFDWVRDRVFVFVRPK